MLLLVLMLSLVLRTLLLFLNEYGDASALPALHRAWADWGKTSPSRGPFSRTMLHLQNQGDAGELGKLSVATETNRQGGLSISHASAHQGGLSISQDADGKGVPHKEDEDLAKEEVVLDFSESAVSVPRSHRRGSG